MADDPLPEAIIGRLSRMRTIESEFAERIDQLAAAGPFDESGTEVFTRLAAVAARHRQALEEVAIRRGAELHGRETTRGGREHEHLLSAQLEKAIVAAASAVIAYDALYASARLLYENEVCDLADAHAAEWAVERSALSDMLAPAVHGELVSAGMTCRCICPTCGIGACGCTRNSVNTIREHWGLPELEPGEGLELRLAPRPGSQLAEAGLERGDRIVAVDGELVHTNPEIQRALRRRPIGESMTMQVLRADEPQEIPRRASKRSPVVAIALLSWTWCDHGSARPQRRGQDDHDRHDPGSRRAGSGDREHPWHLGAGDGPHDRYRGP